MSAFSPGSLDEGVVQPDVGLALDDVDPRPVQPSLTQRLRESVRVDERAARGVHEHRGPLHPLKERLVDDVVRRGPPRREHEHGVALARELRQLDAAHLAHAELRRECGVRGGVGGCAPVACVEAAREAEGDEARERRLGDAPEADEACGARGRGRGGGAGVGRERGELGAAEGEGGPDEVGPLVQLVRRRERGA